MAEYEGHAGAYFCYLEAVLEGGDNIAVKVIQFGDRRRVRCTYCGSLLEYERDYVKSVQTGMNEYENEIECPNCQEKIRVNQ